MRLAILLTGLLLASAAQAQDDVKVHGTIGPTVTANPTPQGKWQDHDTGRYGVHRGVGDPSVGVNLTGRTWSSRPVSLRPRR
jgi:hypothetical protein